MLPAGVTPRGPRPPPRTAPWQCGPECGGRLGQPDSGLCGAAGSAPHEGVGLSSASPGWLSPVRGHRGGRPLYAPALTSNPGTSPFLPEHLSNARPTASLSGSTWLQGPWEAWPVRAAGSEPGPWAAPQDVGDSPEQRSE